ncbi:hypothetical protein RO3G_03706 [Rhizopus delemar RA 99-880]|uniref:Magnesium transporter protein 1 n=1 Tax=Rhizopus delemar (strain RA 99-880 / ATCC MYA-4621 / FGSC 9543 / NRRL 43880) TaxID=246409 RepID=I1BS21_RHIO9|nr:hypothetical protein RO3G_03706 [Rhizopus delemar RA 99-880]|eukprot:EIE79001.1 hypothetical protein RO3G_03706 [Rhizopus delemar RA 99-880]
MKRVGSLFFILLAFIGLVFAQADPKKDKLISLVNQDGLVKLNSNSFDRFAEGKRNYGLVVLLTALGPQFNCHPCRELDPEFTLIAKSFQRNKDNKNLFFGHLDFNDGQIIFQKLQLVSAPNVLYFPPQKVGESKEFIRYDVTKNGLDAESIAEFLTKQTGYAVKVKRPFNYVKFGGQLFLAVGAAAILKLVYRNFGFIFYHKTTWTVASILLVLVMTSGHMWNRIRGPAYVMPTQSGQINYIAAGFSSQLGIESQIVSSIYGCLGLCLLALIKMVPQFEDKTRQRFAVFLWIGCFMFVFSVLLALFKVKNGAYPFKLLI